MLATLPESRRATSWPVRNGAISVAAHAALLAAGVAAAPGAPGGTPAPDTPHAARAVVFVPGPPAAPPPSAGETAASARAAGPPPLATAGALPPLPVVALPVLVDLDPAPALDEAAALARVASTAGEFDARHPDAGLAARIATTGVRERPPGVPYYADEVERMALPHADNPRPRYPRILLGAGIQGAVVVQFVVDSTGAADPRSLRILRSSHELFSRAVRTVLPRMRFHPAEIAGHRVGVVVEQPFSFVVR